MGVLEESKKKASKSTDNHLQSVSEFRASGTLRMRRMAATPEVAMTLALLGTRLRRMGMVASAAWSKRLPSTDDRCLHAEQVRHTSELGTTF